MKFSRHVDCRSRTLAAGAFLGAVSACACLTPLSAQASARERISINDDWRFQQGDPPGNTVSLLYDVRPEVRDQRDDRPADARPEAAAPGRPRAGGHQAVDPAHR
jgi:beta-galactosidase